MTPPPESGYDSPGRRAKFREAFSDDYLNHVQRRIDQGKPFEVREFAWMAFNHGACSTAAVCGDPQADGDAPPRPSPKP